MSVINQMLQDLKSRNVKTTDTDSTVTEEIQVPKMAFSWRTLLSKGRIEKGILVILVLILASVGLRFFFFHEKPLPSLPTPAHQVAPLPVNLKPTAKPPSVAPKETIPAVTVQDNEILIESGDITKIIEPLNNEQLAERAYNQSLLALNDGNIQKAVHELQESLTLQTDYLPSQQAIITLLLQQKQLDLAGKYLDQALNQRPQNIALLQLKARMQLIENNPSAALYTLQSFSPPLAGNTDYYALIAAIHQQLKNFDLAAQLYRQIAMVQPNEGKWWVGLGAALEAQQNMNSAQEAYQRAAMLHTLDPNLQAFVDSKLSLPNNN